MSYVKLMGGLGWRIDEVRNRGALIFSFFLCSSPTNNSDGIFSVSFSVSSPFVLRSFSVRSPFVLRSFSVHSPFVLRSFSVHSPFILRSFSVRESEIDRRTNGESSEARRRCIETLMGSQGKATRTKTLFSIT